MTIGSQRRRMSRASDTIVNALLFNLSWAVIVLTHSPLVALGQVALHLALHFRFLGYGVAELRLLCLVTMLGLVLDQILFYTGVFTLAGMPALAPLWLGCLWPVFATTLSHAFRAFTGRTLVAALVGGFGGAGSYVAGARLTEVDFAQPLWGPVLIGLTWAVIFPALLALAQRLVPDAEQARA